MNSPLHRGSCLCGGVKYEITAEIQAVSHCHCVMCRKAHGAAFGTYGNVRLEHHTFVQGVSLVKRYQSSTSVTRMFCAACGSPLAWLSKGNISEWIAIPLGTLDSAYVPQNQKHIHTSSKAPWYVVCDNWPQNEQ